MVAVQAPDVARMLQRPAERVVEAEVGGVDRGRLLDAALLEQQRAVGVAGRLHPAPRLVVGQRVVEFDCPPQVSKPRRIALAVGDFAVEHRRGDARMSRLVLLNR